MGIWASMYDTLTRVYTALNLKFLGLTNLFLTRIRDLSFRYDLSKYYKSASRNGSVVGLDFNISHITCYSKK